jgi:uncharacterized membrane protein YczE
MTAFKRYLREQIEGNGTQYLTYLAGCFLFSVGAKFFIDSNLGTDPLDVLCIGMTKHLPISIGIASGIVAFAFLSVWSFWNRKAPPLTPFFTTFSVGLLIDLWNFLKIEQLTRPIFTPYLMLLLAVSLCAYASALIIMSGIGIRIMDLVAITMIEKWNWSFFKAKMFLEIVLFSLGWILGGPLGIGTVAFLFGVGPFIQPFMILNGKLFSMNNYGLSRPENV